MIHQSIIVVSFPWTVAHDEILQWSLLQPSGYWNENDRWKMYLNCYLHDLHNPKKIGSNNHIIDQKLIYNQHNPDSKFCGANMGPTWVLSAQMGPMWAPLTLLSGNAVYNQIVCTFMGYPSVNIIMLCSQQFRRCVLYNWGSKLIVFIKHVVVWYGCNKLILLA